MVIDTTLPSISDSNTFLPILAVCNFISDIDALKIFALENGFSGIDWSFDLETLPKTPAEESRWVAKMSSLQSLHVRYHCPFEKIDLGHEDPEHVKTAEILYRRIIRLIAKAGGKIVTIHIGLGRNSTRPMRWDETIQNLRRLVQYGGDHGVKVCLENLAWGWTSKPNLFEKLIRKSGSGVTFDIGHAYVSEAVASRQFSVEDFISPHPDRVYNAHVYHKELDDVGHMPPVRLDDISARLDLLMQIGCCWWVLEIKETAGLMQLKRIVHEYLRKASTVRLTENEKTLSTL